MADLSKYKHFLIDRDLYLENKLFWKGIVENITGSKNEEWLITTFANGEDFFDGNPIYSAIFENEKKAIRLIQWEDSLENPLFTAWRTKFEFKDTSFDELSIGLVLNERTFGDAECLLKSFISNDPKSEVKLLSINQSYLEANAMREAKAEELYSYSIREDALAITNEAYVVKIQALEILNRNLRPIKEKKSGGIAKGYTSVK